MMLSNLKQFRIIYFLIVRDLISLKEDLASIIFASISYPVRGIIIFSYILAGAGLGHEYGIFYFIGVIPSVAIVKILHGLSKILYDFQGDRIIDFELTLPVSANLLFLRKALVLGIKSMLLSLPTIPVGIFMLHSGFEAVDIKPFKLFIFFIVYNLLLGFATVWVSGWIKSSKDVGSFWSRYLHTSWVFGCTLFPWKLFYMLYPTWATIDLLNPVTYIMEGIRSATLSSSDYINFWICLVMVLLFSIFFAVHGLYLIKKRLDVVR